MRLDNSSAFTVPATLALAVALALTLPLPAHAQNSDVMMRSPSASQDASPTRQRTPESSWLRPQFGGRDANLHGRARGALGGGNGAAARAQSQQAPRQSTHDVLVGSDPDLAMPLVPCDALGSSTRRAGPALGAYAPGSGPGNGTDSAAGIGYDPATGLSEPLPSIPSCTSVVSTNRNAGAGDRSTSIYEQLAPDVDRTSIGGRPGTLTVLRPFADD